MIIGITGNIGSGKTTVANMFKELGAFVIDADKVCHSLMQPPKPVYKKIVAVFGCEILKKNKTIDRKKLAEIVFKNRPKLILLNKIVHPPAIREIRRIVRDNHKKKVIVVDAALLVESCFYKKMDKIVMVWAKREKSIKRLIKTRGLSKTEIKHRISAQASFKKLLAQADFFIDNSGSINEAKRQVDKIWEQLEGNYGCK